MRSMIFLAVLLAPLAAFAADDLDAKQAQVQADIKRLEQMQRQIEYQQRLMYEAQVEAAREQALGLMLFGTGPALINGMNQNFRMITPPVGSFQNPMPSSR